MKNDFSFLPEVGIQGRIYFFVSCYFHFLLLALPNGLNKACFFFSLHYVKELLWNQYSCFSCNVFLFLDLYKVSLLNKVWEFLHKLHFSHPECWTIYSKVDLSVYFSYIFSKQQLTVGLNGIIFLNIFIFTEILSFVQWSTLKNFSEESLQVLWSLVLT